MPKWRITSKDLIELLKKHWFVEHHRKGSHCMLKNEKTGKYTVVPCHKKELWIWLTLKIIVQSWLDRDMLYSK